MHPLGLLLLRAHYFFGNLSSAFSLSVTTALGRCGRTAVSCRLRKKLIDFVFILPIFYQNLLLDFTLPCYDTVIT